MRNLLVRLAAALLLVSSTAAPAAAQIVWTASYDDVTLNNGVGFDSDVIFSGSLTHGQLRRDSVEAAFAYLGTVLDGRGTVQFRFNVSQTDGSGSLGTFSAGSMVAVAGSFQNGSGYQAARTDVLVGTSGNGTLDFGYGWNYIGQTANGGNYDLTTVILHEFTHGLGFTTALRADGTGLGGSNNRYVGLSRWLQRGNGAPGAIFNTDITSPGYATFVGPLDTITNGNNSTTGLFFGGQYAREVFGGAVPMYAPGTFSSGSSTSHVNDGNAVMNPNITPNTVKRYLRYEVAMLMDIGWNVYHWDNGSGNWKDGINTNGSFTLANSNWRTDSGIVYDGASTFYNINSSQQQAPVLAPYGQVTSNLVLNFGGSGSAGYTSTNDLGTIRVSRLNLNSSSSATNTITGGALIFGLNSDGTASVLTPKIVQQNSGAFAVNTDLQVNDTTGAVGGGWTGLTVDGTGTGQVTLGGVISGNGTLTKAGGFTLQLGGPAANTFTGVTTVQAGTLLLSKTPGQNAVGGSLTITGGTARLGAANQLPGSGTVTLSGGTLSTGATAGFGDVAGAFEMTSASTIALGTGSHVLQFTGFADSSLAGTLTVTGWAGPRGATGTGGRILFGGVSGDPNATFAGWLTSVQFDGFAQGGLFITTGTAQTYELVPVPTPEPATVLAVAFSGLGVGALLRRRRGRLAEPAAIAP